MPPEQRADIRARLREWAAYRQFGPNAYPPASPMARLRDPPGSAPPASRPPNGTNPPPAVALLQQGMMFFSRQSKEHQRAICAVQAIYLSGATRPPRRGRGRPPQSEPIAEIALELDVHRRTLEHWRSFGEALLEGWLAARCP